MSVITLVFGMAGLLVGTLTALTHECYVLGFIVSLCSLGIMIASVLNMLEIIR